MLVGIIGEAHVGITHEAQYRILVFQQTIMQVVSKRLCDSTTLSFPPWAIPCRLASEWSYTFFGTSGIRPRSAPRSRSG